MRWMRRNLVERPEFPKLVPMSGSVPEAEQLLSVLIRSDPEAQVVDGGSRGLYARVHNREAETAAKLHGEDRTFPLDAVRTY